MLRRVKARVTREWFLVGMISAVLLATFFPGFGAAGGAMHADVASDVGIFLVFLFHGMALSTASLRQGMSRWKLHVLVQVLTFGIFPLLWIPFKLAFDGVIPEGLMLGFLYLCALPSTISSSVAMTAIAKGNVPAAIFNATLSSLLGIFLTPAIVGLSTGLGGQGGLSLGHAVGNIAVMLLLPFVLGQAVRPLCGGFMSRYKKGINTFDKLVILMLVYGSFCDSVKSGLWTEHGFGIIGLTLIGAALFLGMALCVSTKVAGWMGFDTEDRITAIFCGSKKTLASGVPMARLLFGAHPALGLIVLPIMFYHQLQLFACSILAGRYAARFDRPRATEPLAGTVGLVTVPVTGPGR
jgi:solute carrier family 10 (sodium/bile acid cotransporter), member 7